MRPTVVPRLLLLPLLLLALAACADTGGTLGSAGPTPTGSTPATSPSVPATPSDPPASPTDSGTAAADEEYVGLTEQEALARAQQAGVPARVAVRDGESLSLTMDYRQDRLNFTVEDGRVVAVARG